jgi:antitoxin StbD
MTKLLTPHIATMTEMREPHKVLERSGGNPVAILKNSALVGYFVPAEAVQETNSRVATRDEVLGSLKRRKDVNRPVLDYLKDK